MATLNREDVYRSLLRDFVDTSGIPEAQIHVAYQPMESLDGEDWYEWIWEAWEPQPSRTADHIVGRGSVRVFVRSRAQMNSKGDYPIGAPYANVQTVVAAIEGRDVSLFDYATGAGTVYVGRVQFQEVQTDDLGEPSEGIRTIICTAEFLLSASQN